MTPEQEDEVRRALADARPVEGLPAEVAARLDTALADLVAERAAADTVPEPAPVVSLEERRRRRWPGVLVAAAAVSVLAYGVGTSLGGIGLSGGDGAESASAGRAAMDRAGTADSEDGGDTDGGAAEAPEDAPTGLLTDGNGVKVQGARDYADRLIVPRTLRLHSDTFDAEVRRLLRDAAVLDGRTPSDGKARSLAGFLASCERPDVGRGDRLAAVRLDGRPGTLVVRTTDGGTRVAEVYSCGDGSDLLAITRLPGGR